MALRVQANTREDFIFAAYGQFFLWPLASPLVNRNRLTEQLAGVVEIQVRRLYFKSPVEEA